MSDLTKLKPKDLLTEEPDVTRWTAARWSEIERRLERLEQCEALLHRSLGLAKQVGAYPLMDDLQDALAARAALEE